jgi:hypothetical protein
VRPLQADTAVAKGVGVTERAALAAIVDKYNITDADVEALVRWRHDDRF